MKNLIILPDGTEIFSGNARENAIIGCTYTQCVNDGTELSIGSACCNELELKLFSVDGLSIAAGDEIQYYKVDDNGERTKIGVFRCEKPTVAATGTYKFVAYDNVSRLDKDLSGWLASVEGWPYTVAAFAEKVCSACGLSLAAPPAVNASYKIRKFSGSGVTGRMLMQWLGQVACRFIRANADGEIEFAWYTDKGAEITTSGEFAYFGGGLSYEDYQVVEIQKVQIQASENDNGTVYPDGSEEELNTYKITGNYLLTAETGDELKPVAQTIFKQLQGVTYTPCKVSMQATTEINAGDIVHITDRNGVTIATYVMSKINKGQKDTLECTGSYKRDSSTATNTLTMKALNGKVLDIKKDVDGLRISNKDTADKVATIELTVDGLKTSVKDAEGNISKLEQSSEEITASVETVKKTSEEALKEAKKNATDLTNYASQVNGSLTDLQNQIDGAIETWFYDYEPTASNAPASSWKTAEDKNKHLGDLFYIVDNADKGGLVYRWALTNGVYGWILVEDTEVAKALETAAQAKDTADGKRRVFVAQPKPPYDVGDLWTDGTNLRVCVTARASGSYNASDWGLATEYITEAATKALIKVAKDSIEMRVELTEKGLEGAKTDISKLEMVAGQVSVQAQRSEVVGSTYSFGINGSGNLVLTYDGERPSYSINSSGELVLEYEGDTPPETWIGADGALYSTDESAMVFSHVGTLTSTINADGTWGMWFDQNGEVVSSIRFDLATRKFVFDGDIVVGNDLRDDITKITNDTLSTTNVVAKNLRVNAANILGTLTIGQLPDNVASKDDIPSEQDITTITEGTISTTDVIAKYLKLAGSININDNFVVDPFGNVQLNGSISWGVGASPTQAVYAASALAKPADGTKWSSYPESGSGWHRDYAGADYFASYTYDGGATWTAAIQVRGAKGDTGATGAAGSVGPQGPKGDPGSDASVTDVNVFNALTRNGTMYGCFYGADSKLYINAGYIQSGKIAADVLDVNVLNTLEIKAGSVDAENLTGTTITGKVLSGVTGDFSGTVTATYLKAVSGGNIAGWTIDDNSMRIGSLGASGSMWLCNTGTSTSANIGTGSGNGWCIAVGNQFGVKKNGALYASNVDLSGKVTAESGRIGGWNIGNITAKDGSTTLYSGQALYSDSYTEGSDGYPTLVGATLRIALTPKYLILYGTKDGDNIAISRQWSRILAKTA